MGKIELLKLLINGLSLFKKNPVNISPEFKAFINELEKLKINFYVFDSHYPIEVHFKYVGEQSTENYTPYFDILFYFDIMDVPKVFEKYQQNMGIPLSIRRELKKISYRSPKLELAAAPGDPAVTLMRGYYQGNAFITDVPAFQSFRDYYTQLVSLKQAVENLSGYRFYV